MFPGIALSASLAAAGFALSCLPGLAHFGLSPLVYALVLGMLLSNWPRFGGWADAQAGLAFCARPVLRLGVVLFGLQLTLGQVFALGLPAIGLDLLVVCSVMFIGYAVGTRVLGLAPDVALLTCAGSAICGAAAVLATESTIRARPAATAMAVATVVLFGSAAMLLYPLLYPLSGLSEPQFGIYIGATVHEVAQVVAAGDAVGPGALANAVVVKLVRVMLLVPFLLIVGRCWAGRSSGAPGTLTVPWFAFGFVLMVVFNSYVVLPASLHGALTQAGQWALALAMAALGYQTRLGLLKALGWRPFALALMLFVMLALGGLLVVRLLLA
ncbi:YeiH family protein [Pseudomonas sp. KNUC1026]|uniref:YeiH family protein n=1 Tax=Pseudomonas sp. KNUC1026 TaxID=2893890 RepID=UPI001F24CACC|nr:putative sulfate exporter family transporter [Pseudomonas sp. KNUC1026]UFH51100.1 putative sulfate exporter family transporter [Pseudomonas sp. KNUC1026]